MISRKGSTQADDLELFSYYSTYLDNPLEVESFIYPLKRVGVTLGDGSLNISMKKEESVGVLRFEFGFTFHRKVKLSFRNEKLIFLPGETVQLCDIRAYDVPKLISFFEEHEFQCVSSDTSNKIAQLYFQLKPTI
jgi:hypothetical protein